VTSASNDKSRIVVRLDVTAHIGTGHLRRCATLGRVLNSRGVRVHFLVKTENLDLVKKLSDYAEDCVQMNSSLQGRADATYTAEYCRRIDADRAIIDHYEASEAYQRVLLDAGLRWLQFDGTVSTPLWADWVVSMSPAADADRYHALQRRAQTRMLLGPRYAILRDEFSQTRASRTIPAQARRLLLTFGGGDDRGACLACLEALQGVSGFEIMILTSRYNPQVASIRSWLERHPELSAMLLLDDPQIAQRMVEADIAVTAGGTTTFETAMLGLPTIVIPIADNQRATARAWGRIGVAIDVDPLEQLNADRLRRELVSLAADPARRERMARLGQEYVDGRGVERLAQELYPNSKTVS